MWYSADEITMKNMKWLLCDRGQAQWLIYDLRNRVRAVECGTLMIAHAPTPPLMRAAWLYVEQMHQTAITVLLLLYTPVSGTFCSNTATPVP